MVKLRYVKYITLGGSACWKLRFVLISTVLYLLGLTVTMWNLDGSDETRKRVHPALNINSSVAKTKVDIPVILKWFHVEGVRNDTITCKESLRCHVTTDEEVRHQHDVMAITFMAIHFGSHGFPLPRKPGQLWSVMHNESPKFDHYLFTLQGTMEMFNLTSTINRESHYPIPTMLLEQEKDITSREYVVSVQKKNELRMAGLAPIVFIHTDCNTPSDRSHYMRLLQQHIKIDSYGACEHNRDFPTKNLTFSSGMWPMRTRQFKEFFAQYKFAFAFENAVCDDYITEKFWRPIHLGVVPVVFGSPKIKDFAPTDHAIIDIRDFRTVKEVAEYITFLDTHDKEYSKYLDYKRTGVTNPKLRLELNKRDWGPGKTHRSAKSGFDCFVCEKLHELKTQLESGQAIKQWQGKPNHYTCPEPKSFDDEGRYVSHNKQWLNFYDSAKYQMQSIAYHIKNNINAESKILRTFAEKLKRLQDNSSL